MRIWIATIVVLVTIGGCSDYRSRPPGSSQEARPDIRENLAYFNEYLSVEIQGEWLGGTQRVFALHLQATNVGSRSITACLGENTHYLVASQSPQISRWPDTKALASHPGCARGQGNSVSIFRLAPGESFRWSENLELPESFQGQTKGTAWVQLMEPDACTQFGCFSIIKAVETKDAVAVEPAHAEHGRSNGRPKPPLTSNTVRRPRMRVLQVSQ